MSFGAPVLLGKRTFNILDYGARGGGQAGIAPAANTVNDVAINAAATAAKNAGGGFVVIPNDRFYTSSTFTLRLYPRVHLIGDGYGPFDLMQRGDGVVTDPILSTQGPTLILTNTTGQALFFGEKAIIAYDGNQVISDIIFACVQPAAIKNGPTYVPTQYPWVIAGDNNITFGASVPSIWLGGCEIVRCMIYGAWKGIQFWGGRSRCIDTTIEAFYRGLIVDGTADVTYLRGVRFWPLMADVVAESNFMSMNSAQYQQANLIAVQLRRADEVQCQQLFVQTAAVAVDFADTGSNPGPWGTFIDTYLETCVIAIQASRINGNGVQFFGGSIIPAYTSDTTPNNTWLRVYAIAGSQIYLYINGMTVGSGPNGNGNTFIPIIDDAVNGFVRIVNVMGYNVNGVASGPAGRTSQSHTLGGSTIANGYPLVAPPGNGVKYYITASTTGTATVQRAPIFGTLVKTIIATLPPNTTCSVHLQHGETVNVFSSDPNNPPTYVAVGD